MAKNKSPSVQVRTFPDHQVITKPNPLRKVLRRVGDEDTDDPVARAEQALAGLVRDLAYHLSRAFDDVLDRGGQVRGAVLDRAV